MQELSNTPVSKINFKPAVLVFFLRSVDLTPGLAKSVIRYAFRFLAGPDRDKLLQDIQSNYSPIDLTK